MNIFNNLKKPEYFAAQRKDAHQQYLQKRGITEEEYLLELEEKAKKEHQEDLDRLGITEAEFQRREKNAEKKREIKKTLDKYGTILVLLGGIALFIIGIVSEDFREAVKPIILTAGGTWLLFIFVMICIPVSFIINSFIQQSKWNKYLKVIISLLITLLVIAIVGVLLHTCYSGGSSDYYEPGKLRPERF